MESIICGLQSAVCGLQSAVCSLRSAVCKCQTLFIPTLKKGRLKKISRERGFQKPKFLYGKYEARLEFPEGWSGVQ